MVDFTMTDNLYNVSENNNKVYVKVNNTTEHIVTLTNGFYSPSQLATEVKSQLDTIPSHTFTVTYASKTGKFTVAISGSNTFSFTYGSNTANSSRKLLGFKEENTSDAAQHTSPNVADLNPYKVIYGSFEEDSFKHLAGGYQNGFVASFGITGESTFGGVIRYVTPESARQMLKFSKSPAMLSYRFIDVNDRTVDFNGSDWIMTLEQPQLLM